MPFSGLGKGATPTGELAAHPSQPTPMSGDFSFVSGGPGLQRKPQQTGAAASGSQQAGNGTGPSGTGGGAQAAAPPAAPSRPGAIAIPSFREVQQAEKQRAAPPILFRAGGVAAQGATGCAQAALLVEALSCGGDLLLCLLLLLLLLLLPLLPHNCMRAAGC